MPKLIRNFCQKFKSDRQEQLAPYTEPDSRRSGAPAVEVSEAQGKYGIIPMERKDPDQQERLNVSHHSATLPSYPVDIVAVHGLGGDRHKTWMHENGNLWLRDFLPSDLPGSRIFSFGYPSEMFSKSKAKIPEFARLLLSNIRTHVLSESEPRPIIFLCHSLGGIVVKKAIVLAHEEQQYHKPTLDSVRAILFFGTPHQGSKTANFAVIFSNIIRVFPRKDLIRDLTSNSEVLTDISEAFRNRVDDLNFVTFYEMDVTPPLSVIVVEKFSATMGLSQEDIVPLFANHREMCRFPSQSDNSYQTVLSRLRDISKKIFPGETAQSLSSVETSVYAPPRTDYSAGAGNQTLGGNRNILRHTGSTVNFRGPEVAQSMNPPGPSPPRLPVASHVRSSSASPISVPVEQADDPEEGSDGFTTVTRKKNCKKNKGRASAVKNERPRSRKSEYSRQSFNVRGGGNGAGRPKTLQSSCPGTVPRMHHASHSSDLASSESSRTYRIRNVKTTVTKDVLADYLESLVAPSRPKKHLENVIKLRLTPYDTKTQVAVVEFRVQPLELSKMGDEEENVFEPEESSFSNPLVIDTHFKGFTPLFTPLPQSIASSLDSVEVDIIAVTWPGGHAYRSWKARNGNMWIDDFLRDEGIENVRVSTFGYDAKLNDGFMSTISDYASSLLLGVESLRKSLNPRTFHPIIFLGHSLGGLVILQALLDADHTIAESCTAVFLFDVPCNGLEKRGFQGARQHTDTISSLATDSQSLSVLVDTFEKRFVRPKKCRVVSFYASRTSPSIQSNSSPRWITDDPVLWVSEYSATYLTPGGESSNKIGIDADHSTIVRFSEGATAGYRAIVKCLWECVNDAQKKALDHPRLARVAESDTKKKSILTSALNKVDSSQLLSALPQQLDHLSPASPAPIDNNDPAFLWILHDLDFRDWLSSEGTQILWVSAPMSCGLSRLCASMEKMLATEYSDRTRPLVVHFPCTARKGKSALPSFFLHLFHQVAWQCFPNRVHRKGLERDFLQAIIDTGSNLVDLDANKDHLPDITNWISSILEALGSRLSEAIKATLAGVLQSEILVLVLEGLHHLPLGFETGRFTKMVREICEWLNGKCHGLKVLYTSEPRSNLKGLLGDLPCIEHDKERKECLSTLRIKNARHEKIDHRHEKTLEWFWKEEHYKRWANSEVSSFLYVEGKPASGKSVLAKFVIQSLRDTRRIAKQDVLATYFFDTGDSDFQNSHRTMLQSVLYDILNQNPSFFYHFQREFRKHRSELRTSGWQLESLEEVLRTLKRHPVCEKVYVVIDGLDESSDYGKTAKLLQEFKSPRKLMMKILVTSRSEPKFKGVLQGYPKITLQQKNDPDISIYTRSFLNSGLELKPAAIEEYHDHIVRNADNVFLWVKLVRDEVRRYYEGEKKHSGAAFRKFLHSLPRELEGLYECLLQRVSDSNTPDRIVDGIRMFQLVLFTYRPLSVAEFRDALTIPDEQEPNLESFDLFVERNDSLETWIVRCGGNFIEIQGQNPSQVQLLHQSAREFFLIDRAHVVANSNLARSRDTTEGHRTLGLVCVRYLLFFANNSDLLSEFPASPETWTEQKFAPFVDYINDLPFLPYALEYMDHHLDKAGVLPEDVAQLTKALIGKPIGHLLEAWMTRSSHIDVPPPIEKLPQETVQTVKNRLFHYAARSGNSTALEVLLIAGAEVESRSQKDETALSIAVSSESEEDLQDSVVQVLFHFKADPNSRTFFEGTPLHYAGKSGCLKVLRRLIENGADVNARDKQQMTALHRAVIAGNEPAATLLIAHAADVSAGDFDGLKAIHWAAGKGHLPCVKLLLDKGSEVNDRCDEGTVPLHWACGRGHEDVVRFLIEKGANIHGYDRLKRSALRWASRYGHDGVVDLLLNQGANPRWHESSGRTALHWAAQNNHFHVVERLLEEDVEINSCELRGASALSWAVAYGHVAIVDLLLEHGADRSHRGGGTRSFLHWAAIRGHATVAELLLKRGLEPNCREDQDRTPISWAARYGHEDVIELLLLWDADPNVCDTEGRTPLMWAASFNHTDVAGRLLEARADPNTQNSEGETALHWAASRGHTDVITLLKKHHAKVNIKDKKGQLYIDCLKAFEEQGAQHGARGGS